MIGRLLVAALCLTSTGLPRGDAWWAAFLPHRQSADLEADLDRIFSDPRLARALLAVRVDSLGPRGAGPIGPVYRREADRLVMPASNMKLLTIGAAADVLGWDFRYETRLDAAGRIAGGVLTGDLVVTGSGDPSIGSPDGGHAQLFLDWADRLHRSGIRRVEGRLIGDDNAFDDETLGAGWAWDYLAAGYAAPVGALIYNESAAVARLDAGTTPGSPATLAFGPAGHPFDVRSEVVTSPAGSAVSVQLLRAPGTFSLTLRGSVPAGGARVLRTAAVENPTQYFVEALRLALQSRGIVITGGAWDVDALSSPPPVPGRQTIGVHRSLPFSALAGYAMKVSQNLYAEAFLKTLGRATAGAGTASAGLRAVRDRLAQWGIPAEGLVLYDGSGLSRYNYLTASTLVDVLTHVWRSEPLRGRFVAELPVAGRDGSLERRMRGTALETNVQAKTGTISNVRSLSGYLETAAGEKLVFSMIANHFTAPAAEIDAIVERALERLVVK